MDNIKTFLAGRKKYILWSIILTLLFFSFFHYISQRWTFAITRKDHVCLPYKYWIIKKGGLPQRGDYIAFRSSGIPFFADGTRWIKIADGVEGDKIEVVKISQDDRAKFSDKYTETVYVNNMPMSLDIQGYVYLHNQEQKMPAVFKVFKTDTKRRPVPIISSQVIPQGKYFVTSPDQRSFDSRYWGLVDKSWVIGKAYPITFLGKNHVAAR